MSEVNPVLFHRRLRKLLDFWQNATAGDVETRRFLNTGGLLFVTGDQHHLYSDTLTIHRYLLGIDLYLTLTFITPEKVTFLCSPHQAKKLKPLEKINKSFGADVTVSILVKSSHPGPTTKAVNKLILAMENTVQDGKRLGSCTNAIFDRDYGVGEEMSFYNQLLASF
ncbi:uncharacterized protein MELLADRAFT_110155 [Melampsora larici-populina 98AG31]|uniref:FACT complex subunit n=1 Tax=Melampsora larici-populina (strain 98AG31 / pathotype 3-4-7) TaxID=747676 RepID=F4RYV2_MELLP|nr:uncharacterized protein MELLADRAFT_110155 [Melampsora larici-populina 98AG31]EGG02439.1 hypothetical protein MELLADRAFT_110155 [Melampsora larici-populina 98AG31]